MPTPGDLTIKQILDHFSPLIGESAINVFRKKFIYVEDLTVAQYITSIFIGDSFKQAYAGAFSLSSEPRYKEHLESLKECFSLAVLYASSNPVSETKSRVSLYRHRNVKSVTQTEIEALTSSKLKRSDNIDPENVPVYIEQLIKISKEEQKKHVLKKIASSSETDLFISQSVGTSSSSKEYDEAKIKLKSPTGVWSTARLDVRSYVRIERLVIVVEAFRLKDVGIIPASRNLSTHPLGDEEKEFCINQLTDILNQSDKDPETRQKKLEQRKIDAARENKALLGEDSKDDRLFLPGMTPLGDGKKGVTQFILVCGDKDDALAKEKLRSYITKLTDGLTGWRPAELNRSPVEEKKTVSSSSSSMFKESSKDLIALEDFDGTATSMSGVSTKDHPDYPLDYSTGKPKTIDSMDKFKELLEKPGNETHPLRMTSNAIKYYRWLFDSKAEIHIISKNHKLYIETVLSIAGFTKVEMGQIKIHDTTNFRGRDKGDLASGVLLEKKPRVVIINEDSQDELIKILTIGLSDLPKTTKVIQNLVTPGSSFNSVMAEADKVLGRILPSTPTLSS